MAHGFATASRTAHGGTLLYHLHGKRLYRAIGEPDDRHRRPVTLARAIERLMVLDGVLAEPETTWLATPQEKVEHFSKVTSLPPEKLPRRGAGDQEGPRRPFPDALPIGCARDDRPYVFLYLVTGENPLDFRGFLHRHQALLRALPRWEIRLLVPDRLAASVRRFEAAAIEELASPIAPSEPADLRWYFEQQRLVNTGRASDDPARFASLRRAFAVQRYRALYRTWKDTRGRVVVRGDLPVAERGHGGGGGPRDEPRLALRLPPSHHPRRHGLTPSAGNAGRNARRGGAFPHASASDGRGVPRTGRALSCGNGRNLVQVLASRCGAVAASSHSRSAKWGCERPPRRALDSVPGAS